MNLKTRINLVSVSLILAVSASLIVVNKMSQKETEKLYSESEANGQTVLWNKIVASELDAMQANTKALSRDRDTIDALVSLDMEELEDSGSSSYNLLSSSNVLTSLTLLDKQGNAVFSGTEDLKALTASGLAQEASSQGKVVRGIEKDIKGSLQAVVAFPLYKRGKPAGVAVYGKDLASALDNLKNVSSSEVALETVAGKTQFSTSEAVFAELDAELSALDKSSAEHLVASAGEQIFSVVHQPIVDDKGSVLAYLVTARDQTSSFSARNTIDNISYATTAIALIVSVLGLSWYLGRALEPVTRVIGVIREIAEGDLSNPIKECTRSDETGQLATALSNMQKRLSSTVQEVLSGSDKIAGVAREISLGNTDLAQRTEEQSISLENTVVSMEEITTAIQQNADNAGDARDLSDEALDRARTGVNSIQKTISAVEDIKQSSSEISEIISLIDEIAFQTNLLALNAAVEAARAGDQGRGFAVVASEVRALAQRSAGAARDITGLIQTSIERVGIGTSMVENSGETLQEIMQSVEQVSELISGIADTSQQQAIGIQELNSAMAAIDGATQKNTAMVEETAVASQLMVEQADVLKQLMGFFKLSDREGSTPAYSRNVSPPSRGNSLTSPAPIQKARATKTESKQAPDWGATAQNKNEEASWETF